VLNSKRIILASASVNRKNILEKAGLHFEQSPSTFEENLPHSSFATSSEYVVKTSEMKLLDKVQEFNAKGEFADIIIVADTIISIGDKEIIEKPRDKAHAFEILRKLSDVGSHEVLTSVWIAFLEKREVGEGSTILEVTKKSNILDRTRVFFEPLSDEVIQAYIESGEPFGKAGGYGIQGQAATFISRIEGCYYSVWGLPLAAFCTRLREMLL
jgi:septum formation protein